MWLKLATTCALLLHIKCSERFIVNKNDLFNNLNATLHDYKLIITGKCRSHLIRFMQDLELDKLWALKMFDSSSKLPSGILQGNNEDLGTFDECINTSEFLNTTDDYITGKYCLGKMPLSLTADTLEKITGDNKTINLKLASCFPDSSSTRDIETVYNSLSLNVTIEETTCQSKNVQDHLDLDVQLICGISFLIAIVLVLFLSTVYEAIYLLRERDLKYEVLKAFSLISNVKKIFEQSVGEDGNRKEILCINGIRVLSIVWIILDHRLGVQASFPISNHFDTKLWLNNPLNMLFVNGQLAVDTFFLLSGTVITYSYKIYLAQKKNLNVFQYILHRYLRLTPALIGVILFIVTLLEYIGSGPFWPDTMQRLFIRGCNKHWWKTLLYIQNYGRQTEMCIPHGWYLSTDFQLFLVSPIFLLLFKKSTKLAISIIVTMLLCNITLCFLIGWFLELNAFIVANFDFEKNMQFVWNFHFPAYTRASAWLVGLVLGHFLYESRVVKKIEFRKSILISLWVFCTIIIMACVFGGNDLIKGKYNRLANSVHIALVRPSWAIALSWVILACVNGYAGLINTFLSMYVFKVLARLTYSLYLVHYIVIYVFTTPIRTALVFNGFQTVYAFCGDFVLSLFSALVLSLCFELPVVSLEKYYFRRRTGDLMIAEAPAMGLQATDLDSQLSSSLPTSASTSTTVIDTC